MQVRSIAGDTVCGILYRYLGRDDDEIERAFYTVNPGIAAYGPTLPVGIVVTIPEIKPQPVTKVIKLWD